MSTMIQTGSLRPSVPISGEVNTRTTVPVAQIWNAETQSAAYWAERLFSQTRAADGDVKRFAASLEADE